ncbi:MAG: hypothetical protein GC189_00790 [Alphaproteobacteria bacterium]|nr:hypothetical protein [Alphaproteobacteria bacterium]
MPAQTLSDARRVFEELAGVALQALFVHRNQQPIFVNQAFCDVFGFETADQALDPAALKALFPEAIWRDFLPSAAGGRAIYGRRAGHDRYGRALVFDFYARSVAWREEPADAVALVDVSLEDALWRASLVAPTWRAAAPALPGDLGLFCGPLTLPRQVERANRSQRIALATRAARGAPWIGALAQAFAGVYVVEALEDAATAPLAVLDCVSLGMAPLAAVRRFQAAVAGRAAPALIVIIAPNDADIGVLSDAGAHAVLTAPPATDALARAVRWLSRSVDAAELDQIQQQDGGEECADDAKRDHARLPCKANGTRAL